MVTLNKLSNLDRMRAILDAGVLDQDPSTKLNNIHYLFPIAEAEVVKLLAFAKEIRSCPGPKHEASDQVAKEFEDEAKEWKRLAKAASKILGIEPDIRKRRWFGVSQFHGFREKSKDGKITREGGHWSIPKHGQHHAFLTQEDAQAWADMQYGLLKKWSQERGLECPYRIMDMGTKPYEETL